MGSNPRSRSRTHVALALTLAVVLSLLVVGPPASAGMRGRMLQMLNNRRDNRGLRPLRLNLNLSHKAKRHTRKMERRDRLFHSDRLASTMTRLDANRWGENVGCASSMRRVVRAFMRSREHRENILARRFRKIGIGVLSDRRSRLCGRRPVWTTQAFYG